MTYSCAVCESPIQPFISFGKQPIANGFLKPEDFSREYFFELKVAFCSKCAMVQLTDQPEPQMMFNENYAFFSGTSKYMGLHFADFAREIRESHLKQSNDPFVVELGSNDGIMLKNFAQAGIRHLGVEPSTNVAAEARKQGVNTISRFFDESAGKDIRAEYGQADAILAANVMCHIRSMHEVIKGFSALLKPDGVIAFEDPYLGDIVTKTSYDQIYDEHMFLFSLTSISSLFGMHGFELFDAAPQGTHGGSMRYYLCRKGAKTIQPRVKELLAREKDLGLGEASTYERFRANCEKSKSDLVGLLKQVRAEGKRVVGYAATSKSTTVLNYCGVGPELIEFISDTTPIKQGKFSPGVHIPVKPHAEFAAQYPEYALLFGWNHQKEILEKEKAFVDAGGKWILYVPRVEVR